MFEVLILRCDLPAICGRTEVADSRHEVLDGTYRRLCLQVRFESFEPLHRAIVMIMADPALAATRVLKVA